MITPHFMGTLFWGRKLHKMGVHKGGNAPFGIRLCKTVPLPYGKAYDCRSLSLREGAGGGMQITCPALGGRRDGGGLA